jgi:hypothetical protein
MLARNSHLIRTVLLGINCSNGIVRAVYYPFLSAHLELTINTIKFEKLN